jgi:glycerophosphoryl diester phosphodiesterase
MKITAHRGASGYAPENTLASVQLAINMKSDFVEIDVRQTADQRIVLLHDTTLKRTTGLKKRISDVNYSDIEEIDAGSWFSKDFSSEKIPTLEQVLNLIKGKIKINIELKETGNIEFAINVLSVVKDAKMLSNTVFTSFDIDLITAIKEKSPRTKTGLILSRKPSSKIFLTNIDVLSINRLSVNRKLVARAKEHGKEIHVWTVNSIREIKKFEEMSVDNIITNYPDKVQSCYDQL